MLRLTGCLNVLGLMCASYVAQSQAPEWRYDDAYKVMTDGYWKHWNADVQKKIDADIDKFRKADAVLRLGEVADGTEVKVEQISHAFVFGANIFNYNQLGTTERNNRYKYLFGTLFNSATIPFYWKKFEMQQGRPRFREEYWDTEAYWNKTADPKKQPHWRRPAPDPIVAFCENKGIRRHGHTIIWGNQTWHHPEWLYEEFCPEEEKKKLGNPSREDLKKMTPQQVQALAPVFTRELDRLFSKRVTELAGYYRDRLQSWDVVNESVGESNGNSFTKAALTLSKYGIPMPGDYTFKAFRLAAESFPDNVLMNINDNVMLSRQRQEAYLKQITDLSRENAGIDIVGAQMHLFNPQQCLDIAAGSEIQTPVQIWDEMRILSQAGLPIHLSEITITAPGDDARGRAIQSVVAYNQYRLWFSIEKMMGITWWNIVDDCGAPGEPTTSGLFTRNMEPKPSFHALNQLINHEWKTNLNTKADANGQVVFRGFKGKYRVTWKDKGGNYQERIFDLTNNGDGF